MPKVNDTPSRVLRLGCLAVLRALAGGTALNRKRLTDTTGITASPADLGMLRDGLVTKVELDIDGVTEAAFRITSTGRAALAASGMTASSPVDRPRAGSVPKIGALVPWFGSSRLMAEEVGRAVKGAKVVAVPFAGGMCELAHIDAPTLIVNDLHRHVINLARVVAHPVYGPAMLRRLRRHPFHPDELSAAQRTATMAKIEEGVLNTKAAEAYFISQWMGRSGKAGTDGELNGALSARWNGNGGDSAIRWSNAVMGLRDWRRILARASFRCMDWEAFMKNIKDDAATAIYADPPWPETGDAYSHSFTESQHKMLAMVLGRYTKAHVVMRNLDHPLVRQLYPDGAWHWKRFENRNAGRAAFTEVMISNQRAG